MTALIGEAEALAAQLAALPTHAIGLIKRALDASETHTLSQQLALEQELQREAGYARRFPGGRARLPREAAAPLHRAAR